MWVYIYWSEKRFGYVSASVIVGGLYVRENNGQETVDQEKDVVPKMCKRCPWSLSFHAASWLDP